MSTQPTVTRLPERLSGCSRYRLEGGDLKADWAASVEERGTVAWCEITVWDGSDQLGSYGGEVWPGAWPELFECHRGSVQSGPFTIILPACRTLLDAADLAVAS